MVTHQIMDGTCDKVHVNFYYIKDDQSNKVSTYNTLTKYHNKQKIKELEDRVTIQVVTFTP